MAEYKASKMKPIDPMKEVANKGEYASATLEMTGRNATPSKGNGGQGEIVDGPFGGKKPDQ